MISALALRYVKASDVEVPSKWFEEKKMGLANLLSAKVSGDNFLLVASKIDTLANFLNGVISDLQSLASSNPYVQKVITQKWDEYLVSRLQNGANSYRKLEEALAELPSNVFYSYIEQITREIYKRAVKNTAAALDNGPYLSLYSLESLENTIKKAASPAIQAQWGNPNLTSEALEFFKSAKVKEKYTKKCLSKGSLGDPLKLLDNFFEGLGKSQYLEPSFYNDRGIARERAIGKAKLVILDPSASPELDAKIINSFTKAYALLKRKGLERVWYGLMTLVNTEGGKFSKEQTEQARAMGYDVSSFAGTYDPSKDEVEFFNRPGEELIFTIAHELGHRYWFKVLDSSQRAWFSDMVATRPTTVDEQKYRDELDYLPGETDSEGFPKPVKPVTNYGGTNVHEAFAEVFAYYVTNKEMDRDQLESFSRLLKKGHTKQAAAITKQWIMAVRRGWISLLKPTINNYEDVFKAFHTLSRFVDNLREQALYVNRGPKTSLTYSNERADLEKEWKLVHKFLDDARTKARYWYDAYNDKVNNFDPEAKANGERMLEVYRKDFASAVEGWNEKVNKTKSNPSGNPIKIPAEELLDRVLKVLYEDARTRKDMGEEAYSDDERYKQFDLNGVKVVINDATVTAFEIEDYIKEFDKAQALLRSKGLGSIWRGKVYVECEECGGINPNGADFGVGGHYFIGKDFINIYSRPRNIHGLLIHELAHKFWFKDLSSAQRAEFEDYFASGEIPAVSRYGQSNAEEAFAEVIRWIATGNDVSRAQLESVKAILSRGKVPLKVATTVLPEVNDTLDRCAEDIRKGIEAVINEKGEFVQKYLLPLLQEPSFARFKKQDILQLIHGVPAGDSTSLYDLYNQETWRKTRGYPTHEPFMRMWKVKRAEAARILHKCYGWLGKKLEADTLRKVGNEILEVYRNAANAAFYWRDAMNNGNRTGDYYDFSAYPGLDSIHNLLTGLYQKLSGWSNRISYATSGIYPETSSNWLWGFVKEVIDESEPYIVKASEYFDKTWRSLAKTEIMLSKAFDAETKLINGYRKWYRDAGDGFSNAIQEWRNRNWNVVAFASPWFDLKTDVENAASIWTGNLEGLLNRLIEYVLGQKEPISKLLLGT